MAKHQRNPVGNKLLAALPQDEYASIMTSLEPVVLPLRQRLYTPHEPIDYIYFPNSSVVSLLTVLGDGEAVEVATVGSEGMIGVPIVLGVNQLVSEAIVQVAGEGLRMRVDAFRNELTPGGQLHTMLLRYTQVLMNQIAQTAGCNRLHSVEERACRWLLMTQDRVEADRFPLTQEFLAQMLGVRRASVSVVAATLQKAGLISYCRGKMTILDRKGLEACACECYQIFNQQYTRIMS